MSVSRCTRIEEPYNKVKLRSTIPTLIVNGQMSVQFCNPALYAKFFHLSFFGVGMEKLVNAICPSMCQILSFLSPRLCFFSVRESSYMLKFLVTILEKICARKKNFNININEVIHPVDR